MKKVDSLDFFDADGSVTINKFNWQLSLTAS